MSALAGAVTRPDGRAVRWFLVMQEEAERLRARLADGDGILVAADGDPEPGGEPDLDPEPERGGEGGISGDGEATGPLGATRRARVTVR